MADLSKKRFFLLDMDGTIYLDETLFDGTLDFLEKVKSRGGKYLFLTNNSSKGVDAYVSKMARIGICATADDFLTSTDATIAYIRKNHSETVFYTVGTPSFVRQLRDAGIFVTEDGSDARIGGVLLSNDTSLSFEKLDTASRLLSLGSPVYLATNPDWTCPTSYGYVPDCGSFAEMLARATGKRPYFIGKPRPDMVFAAMEKFGYGREETVMVGDRLYTDIAAGEAAGVETVFVLSGEGTLSDLDVSDVKPSFVMKNIRELCESI